MTTQPPPTPAPAQGPGGPPKRLLAVVAALVLVAAGVAALKLARAPSGASEGPSAAIASEPAQLASAAGSTVSGAPPQTAVVELPAPTSVYQPAFWLDVLQPKAVHQAIKDNQWLRETTQQPLGRGFLGPWAGFFGTRGQDIKARFSGLVLDLFSDALLVDPYRVLWLTGERSAHVPVVVVPEASDTALAAFATLVAAAGQGGFAPQGCDVGSGASGEALPDGGARGPAAGLDTIHRLVLGDSSLFVARVGKRLVLSMRPHAVLLGVCLDPIELKPQGHAVELGVALNQNGRALQSLASILGLGAEARLALSLEGTAFTPKGIVGALDKPGRLAAAGLDESMLKLVPEPTTVFFSLALALPAVLEASHLKAQLAGEPVEGSPVQRQLAVLWNPRGDPELASEVAVIWSRLEDEPFFDAILSKSHPLLHKRVCGHLVLASSAALLKAMETSCSGASPSVLSAAPAVAKGLRVPSSLGVNVNLGGLLSRLLLDGFASDGSTRSARVTPPPEIEAAKKQLEALPFLHWHAVVDDKGQLLPGGFRS